MNKRFWLMCVVDVIVIFGSGAIVQILEWPDWVYFAAWVSVFMIGNWTIDRDLKYGRMSR